MITNRKLDMYERRVLSMQRKVDKLEEENEALRSKNQQLLDNEKKYQEQLTMVDEARQELLKCIAEAQAIKEQYNNAVYETRKTKKELIGKMKPLIKDLKHFK